MALKCPLVVCIKIFRVVANQLQLLKRLTNPSMQNNILEILQNVTEMMFVTNNLSRGL